MTSILEAIPVFRSRIFEQNIIFLKENLFRYNCSFLSLLLHNMGVLKHLVFIIYTVNFEKLCVPQKMFFVFLQCNCQIYTYIYIRIYYVYFYSDDVHNVRKRLVNKLFILLFCLFIFIKYGDYFIHIYIYIYTSFHFC